MIDVTVPAAVRMTISDTTLSETIFSIMPGKRFRMLVLMAIRRMYYRTTSTVYASRPKESRVVEELIARSMNFAPLSGLIA